MKKFLVFLVIAILIIIGLVCYFVQGKIDETECPGCHAVLGNVGSVVLISGLLTLLNNLIVKKYDDERLQKLLGLSESVTKSGLKTILTNCSEYNYTTLIEKSETFSVIMNDGLRWVGNNTPALEKRFNRKHSETELFLVDPEGEFLKVLAEKTSMSADALIAKIRQTVSLVESTYEKSGQKGVLRVYYLRHYPTQTVFYADDCVIVTPYQTSSGRSVIPLYEYGYEEDVVSIASHLVGDLGRVREESVLISENGKHLI